MHDVPRGPQPAAILHRRNLLVVHVGPESPGEFVAFAGGVALQAHSRVVLLHLRTVPDTLPLGAMRLAEAEPRFLDRFRAAIAGRGLQVAVEVLDTRHAGRALVERAQALRARAVLMAAAGSRRGRLGPLASYALRHLDGPRLVLFAG